MSGPEQKKQQIFRIKDYFQGRSPHRQSVEGREESRSTNPLASEEGQCEDSGSFDEGPQIIPMEAAKKSMSQKRRLNEKTARLKGFADKLHDLISEAVKNGEMHAHEMATVLAHYSKDVANLSFERVEPEIKRAQREKLKHFLAKIICKDIPLSPVPVPVSDKPETDLGNKPSSHAAPGTDKL